MSSQKWSLRALLEVMLLSFLIIFSGCVNVEGNASSKDKHLIEAEMSIFPPYLTSNSEVSVKLELKNTGYGSVYIPYGEWLPNENKKESKKNIDGPCMVEHVDIFPPPTGKEDIELKENQNKLFTWIIKGKAEVGKECTIKIDIPYRGKVTYIKYIPVINEGEAVDDNSLYTNFRGEEVKDEHSNLDVSVHVMSREPVVLKSDENKPIRFQLILRNKGDATATIDYRNGKKDITLGQSENMNVECTPEQKDIKDEKIKIGPGSQKIIECEAYIKRLPKIAAKYRIQVNINYQYDFKRDVRIPIYTNKDVPTTPYLFFGNIHLGYEGKSPLTRIFVGTAEAMLQQVLPAVVSDVLDISSREMSEALQTYMKMQFGTNSGMKQADKWARQDGRKIAEIIFSNENINSKGIKCDKSKFKDLGCTKEEIKNTLIKSGCDKVIIKNRIDYWSKSIDEVFERDRDYIIQRIKDGVREGILSNGNEITDMYRDRILDDLRIKLGDNTYLNLNLGRVVNAIIEKQLIEGLVGELTSSQAEAAYLNYKIGFKSSFLQEYKSNIIDEVAGYASGMCLRREGIWGGQSKNK